MSKFNIGQRQIGNGEPTCFIADISANHDGDLERAKTLIQLAAAAGADVAKFQNFRANKIVSEYGFDSLGEQLTHQSTWKKSVYQVYQEASLPWEWTPILKAECDTAGIEYLSTPYDLEAVDMLDPFAPVFKIGSGDITWLEMLRKVASKGKPVILSTGASSIGDVQRAVHVIQAINLRLVLMQCNTNYTVRPENFKDINLNVLKTYRAMFPEVILGLSDHTPGQVAVLGAVALGASVVEKHFTDNTSREGPDHAFSMTPTTWREMIDRTRELEYALGSVKKRVTSNERQTVVVQRRCLRATCDLSARAILTRSLIEILRPAPPGSIPPNELQRALGMRLRQGVVRGEHLRWTILEAL